MLELKDIDAETLTDFFIKDPALCYLGLPDQDLVDLHKDKKFSKLSTTSVFKGFYSGETLVSVLKYEWFTYDTVNVHFYIPTHLQRQGFSQEIGELICKYFVEHTIAIKIIIMIPSTCAHTLKATTKFGMKEEGRLTKALRWRNEIVDIIIHSLNLTRG